MQVKFQKLNVDATVPQYAHDDDSGMDLCSCIDCTILPSERRLIPTGLSMQLPRNVEAQIRPRSGLALKHGITVLNTPGTIDAGYRGEIGVILINLSADPYIVKKGDRIAQLVFQKIVRVVLRPSLELRETERGKKGYGSTGYSR